MREQKITVKAINNGFSTSMQIEVNASKEVIGNTVTKLFLSLPKMQQMDILHELKKETGLTDEVIQNEYVNEKEKFMKEAKEKLEKRSGAEGFHKVMEEILNDLINEMHEELSQSKDSETSK